MYVDIYIIYRCERYCLDYIGLYWGIENFW